MDKLNATKELLSKFGISDDGYTDADIEHVLQAVSDAQSRFGLIRMQLGALLMAVKNKEMWRGKAGSYSEYLESERIKPSAASQYTKVAEKLLFEVKLAEDDLEAVSRCSMTTLIKACSVMNRQNKDEIVSILETLSDRDTNHVLNDLEEHKQPLNERRPTRPEVKKLLNEFYKLPNDLRVDVMRQLGSRNAVAKLWHANHPSDIPQPDGALRIVVNTN